MKEFKLNKKEEFEIVNKSKSAKCVCLDEFLQTKNFGEKKLSLCLKAEQICLDKNLFGKNLYETKMLQKQNNQILIESFKKFKKVVGVCKKQKIELNKKVFVDGFDKYKTPYYATIFEILLNGTFVYKGNNKLIYVYDKMCEVIDKAYFDINPCGFENGKCANPKQINPKNPNACCNTKCKYLGKNGCTTTNICCKIFYCQFCRSHGFYFNVHTLLPLKVFWRRSMRELVRYNFFRSREDVLKKLYFARYLGFLVV